MFRSIFTYLIVTVLSYAEVCLLSSSLHYNHAWLNDFILIVGILIVVILALKAYITC